MDTTLLNPTTIDRTVPVLTRLSGPERLAELDLSVDIIARALRRGDQQTATCSALDPPIMEGLLRWGRTTAYLREELIPAGWAFDNPRNLARTIHPSGEFVIVVATGDDRTGRAGQGAGPRHAKGYATEQAVLANGQLSFEFGSLLQVSEHGQVVGPDALQTWFLLFHAEQERFRVELSLPAEFEGGRITRWTERILLPAIPRDRGPRQDDATVSGIEAPTPGLHVIPTASTSDWLADTPQEPPRACIDESGLTGDTHTPMTSVSVRELRNHGGEVLDRVATGESLTVTRDDAEVAEIRPLPRRGPSAAELIDRRRHLPLIDPQRLRDDIDAALDPTL